MHSEHPKSELSVEDGNQSPQSLGELALVFLRLGCFAFGGPAAHIAMMEDEVVHRQHWMSRETLLDLIGVTNLLPGPNSTELAIHIGYERAGWRGLFVAGGSFILPAMGLVWVLAIGYVKYQSIPQVEWLLYGIKPVIIAVVFQALLKLGRKALKDWPTRLVGIGAIAAYLVGLNEISLLLCGGLAVMGVKNVGRKNTSASLFLLPTLATTSTATISLSGMGVFLFFLKVGAVLYGSGYVLLAFLQRDLVEQHHWLTSQQLLDAVAIGQMTPGPVFTTATFVGYLLDGHVGAIAATVGIFLPAFLLVGLVNPWVPKLRQSPWTSAFLDGVNAASLGLMAGVTVTLGQAALIDLWTIAIALISAIAVLKFKVNPIWLLLSSAGLSLMQHWILQPQ